MKAQYIKIALMITIFSFTSHGNAEDITDTVTDVEEITADSDAHKAQAQAARQEASRERAENAKVLREAIRVRQNAEAKRAHATEMIKQSESDLQRMAEEKRLIQKDIDKLEFNVLAAERILQKSKDKLDKSKQDNAALELIKKEKADKLAALSKEQMQIVRETSAAEDEHALLERQVQKSIEDEKVAIQSTAKANADAIAKRGELEKRITVLKERYRQMREQRQSAEADVRKLKTVNYRLEQTVKAGQDEVEPQAARD